MTLYFIILLSIFLIADTIYSYLNHRRTMKRVQAIRREIERLVNDG